jgi:hypothetical protein
VEHLEIDTYQLIMSPRFCVTYIRGERNARRIKTTGIRGQHGAS